MPRAARQPAQRYVFDREAVRRVDQTATEQYHIPGIVLMENAARALAAEALDMLGDRPLDQATVLILCGGGNNGGDGYALARHLHNAGVRVVLAPLVTPREGGDASVNARICRRLGLSEVDPAELDGGGEADLVVDALLGTGLTEPVRGTALQAIQWINRTGKPVLAVDLPSGLDCNTGQPLGDAVRAQRTVSFVGLKRGFLHPVAASYTGRVIIGDIGAPRELVEQLGEAVAGADF